MKRETKESNSSSLFPDSCSLRRGRRCWGGEGRGGAHRDRCSDYRGHSLTSKISFQVFVIVFAFVFVFVIIVVVVVEVFPYPPTNILSGESCRTSQLVLEPSQLSPSLHTSSLRWQIIFYLGFNRTRSQKTKDVASKIQSSHILISTLIWIFFFTQNPKFAAHGLFVLNSKVRFPFFDDLIIFLNNFWSLTIKYYEGFPGAARDPSSCCRKSHRRWSPLSEFYFKFNFNFEYPLYYFCSVIIFEIAFNRNWFSTFRLFLSFSLRGTSKSQLNSQILFNSSIGWIAWSHWFLTSLSMNF